MHQGTRSILSFPWVISLFGVTQLANILGTHDPNQSVGKVVATFGAITRATEAQFEDVLQSTFQISDRLQRGYGGRAV